jgi:HD-GYP domain-containing protein (c-di-GMP phosphodiesterase class II)
VTAAGGDRGEPGPRERGTFMAQARVERMVAFIARAINARALYGAGHPQLEETTAPAVEAIRAVCEDRRHDSTTILLFRDELVVDDRPLRRGEIHQQPLIRLLKKRQIERLTLARDIEAAEFAELIDALSAGRLPGSSRHVILGTLEVAEPPGDGGGGGGRPGLTRVHVEEAADGFLQFRSHGAAAFPRLDDLVWTLVDSVTRSGGILVPLAPLKSHDEYTYVHSINVSLLVIAQGRSLGLQGSALHGLGVAALLHDVGKLSIPLSVLNKPGRLDGDEWKIMQSHAELGARRLAASEGAAGLSVLVAYEHHLRYDGLPSYPRLERRRKPTLASQLTTVADVYDAVSTARPYRPALTRQAARDILRDRAGTLLDPFLVGNFFRLVDDAD